ncbi:MAG: carbamoyltransferase HypF [Anaerolineales bacterium]
MSVKSVRAHVSGIVQGVGFRPFVYGLAERFALRGWVSNNSAGVDMQIEGEEQAVQNFLRQLAAEKPPLAVIDALDTEDAPVENFSSFEILRSTSIEGAFQPVSPDVAICADCERELFDPQDRRYLYPFINCTNCGPRFTIIKDLPYDRPATTMSEFSLCEDCRAEYENPRDRRFHAQPVACAQCGPDVQLRYITAKNTAHITLRLEALLRARKMLRDGKILAIKGLGGFHLACDATNESAVKELRKRKGRAEKPLAVMFASLTDAMRCCEISPAEQALLTGREKPIVLLRVKAHSPITREVAPGIDALGVMLPYTPLHHLLLNQTDRALNKQRVPSALVMTSGNFSEEPIAIDNEDAQERLAPLADAFLLHNREIHLRCDDSVVRVENQTEEKKSPALTSYIRRSRGYAPYPVYLPFEMKPTLAVGGELKNTFCLARERYAFLSQHIGDMENVEVYDSFEENAAHLARLFRVAPRLIAHDLHPNYFTTKYAQQMETDAARIPVQHHHAHIAACMADNGLENRPVIGLAYDGTGYGSDGMIWGGEILLASYAEFERVARLEYLPLPGGDSATRAPWRIALGYAEALQLNLEGLPFLASIRQEAQRIVRQQTRQKINAPLNSSMGRLFDAVASLSGLRVEAAYEAQAAIELECAARPYMDAAQPYPYQIQNGVIGLRDLLQNVIADARAQKPAGYIGARLHRAVCDFSIEVCQRLRAERGVNEVALSGGVWQNQILFAITRAALLRENFIVYTHRQTPANDGGLALGQAVIANFQIEGDSHVLKRSRKD